METDDSAANVCPICQAELAWPDEGDWVVCSGCGQRLNVPGQRAFVRAEAAFLSARESLGRGYWSGSGRRAYTAKARPDALPLAPDVVRDLQQTYAGLHTAFGLGLPEVQLRAGVEMMAEVMRLLAPRGMASPLETEYWIKLAFGLTARDELRSLQQRLEPSRPAAGLLQRVRWRLRHHQLTVISTKLRGQLRELERAIGFVERPSIGL